MKVLLIGDSCTDQIISGTCDRISPEAPVPILKVNSITNRPGMAGNVKANLESFGVNVVFYTNDQEIIKARMVDSRSGQHLLRVDIEDELTPFDIKLAKRLSQYDAIVISDYDKGFISYDHVAKLRSKFKGPIFIDTKKTDLAKMDGCFVKINSLEYNRATSYPNEKFLIVTKGGEGALYKGKIYQAPKVNVFDVCGAGDTFLAALTYKYLVTNDMDNAILFANKCAAITVQNVGVYNLTELDLKSI